MFGPRGLSCILPVYSFFDQYICSLSINFFFFFAEGLFNVNEHATTYKMVHHCPKTRAITKYAIEFLSDNGT